MHMKTIFTSLTLFTYFSLCFSYAADIDWGLIKANVCTPEHKYKMLQKGSNPVEVSAGLGIIQIYDFNEESMQFTLQGMLRLAWIDPTLDLNNMKIDYVHIIPDDVNQCLWKPDIVFYNCKDSAQFAVTVPNTVTKIMPGGIIYQYSRYAVTVGCQLDLRNYPMDTQECSLFIQFFSSRNKQATLSWFHESKHPKTKKISSIDQHDIIKNKLQQFKIEQPEAHSMKLSYTSGNTTILDCRFKFTRYTTSSFVNTYLPSFLVVWVSYVSFYLDVDAVPGRVTLGVTAFLTIATQMVSARNALPTVNYITAIDVWLFGCLFLVFMSLIEFVMSYAITKAIRSRKVHSTTSVTVENIKPGTAHKPKIFLPSDKDEEKIITNRQILKVAGYSNEFNLDNIAKRVYPVLTLTFSISYWIFYLNYTNKLS